MIPLTMAKPGETVTVRRITGKDDVRQHLAELGFVVDTEVTVVSSLAGGLIVQVKDCRVAMDQSMASRIMFRKKEKGVTRDENTERCTGR